MWKNFVWRRLGEGVMEFLGSTFKLTVNYPLFALKFYLDFQTFCLSPLQIRDTWSCLKISVTKPIIIISMNELMRSMVKEMLGFQSDG